MHSIFVLCEDSYKEKVKAYFKFEEDTSSMDTGVQESGGGTTLDLNLCFYPTDKIGKRRKGYDDCFLDAKQIKADTIVCSLAFLDVAVKLAWQLEFVDRWILIDGEDPFQPEPDEKKIQSLLWDDIAKDGDDAIRQSGWISSITGNPFTNDEMDEYSENVVKKIEEYLNSTDRVLEIGVASGITCFSLAPLVSEYYGIDVSQETIEKTMRNANKKGILNVSLEQYDASEVDQLVISNVNCVVINSVAQYFTGYNYFLDVIKKCISVMADKGIIFLGDILSFEMLEDFEHELKEVSGKGRNKRDLWYPQKLIEAVPALLDCVDRVEVTSKLGKIDNELKKYRKDALIFIDKTKRKSGEKVFAYSLKWKDIIEIAKENDDRDFWEVLNGKNCNGLFG